MKVLTLFLCVLTVQLCFSQEGHNDSSLYYFKKGQRYLAEEKYGDAATFFQKGITNYNKSKNDTLLPQLYNNLGIAYYFQGDLGLSIENYERATDLYEALGLPVLTAQTRFNLGLTYKKKGMYSKAFEILIESLEYFEKHDDKTSLSSTYNALGNIRKELSDYSESIVYHKKALKVRREIDYKKGIAQSLHNMGQVYLLNDEIDSADLYLHKALELKRSLNKPILLASTLSQLGELGLKRGDLTNAYNYHLRAYNIRRSNSDKIDIATSLINLSKVELLKGNTFTVDTSLTQAWNLVFPLNSEKTLLEIAEQRVKWSKLNSNEDISLWYERISSLRESLFNSEKQETIERLEIEYEVKENRKKLELEIIKNGSLTDENKILESSNEDLIFGTTIAVLISLLLIILTLMNRQKRKLIEKQSMEIEHIHEEYKHRTKNHFEIILAMLDPSVDEYPTQSLELIDEYRSRVEAIAIINKHLVTKDGLESKEVDLKTYLSELIRNVHLSLGGSKRFDLKYNITSTFLTHDKALKIGIILNELFTNSCKYGKRFEDNLKIEVTLEEEQNQLQLTVEDNGNLKEDHSDYNTEKDGLGLELIRHFIDDLNGKQSVDSDTYGYKTIVQIPKNG